MTSNLSDDLLIALIDGVAARLADPGRQRESEQALRALYDQTIDRNPAVPPLWNQASGPPRDGVRTQPSPWGPPLASRCGDMTSRIAAPSSSSGGARWARTKTCMSSTSETTRHC